MSCRSKNEDRLTHLPEEVLSHILSLMPTKFAVRTSILSKRWRYNWMSVTNLDFDDIHPVYSLDCFSEFVDRVLEHWKTSQVRLFRLRFSGHRAPKSSLSKWISEAIKLNVCEIDIKVRIFELPLNLFTCKTLTKLRLDATGIDDLVVPFPVILPDLKTLNITVQKKPSFNAFRLINGCPVLESLSLVINVCKDDDYIFNIRSLKRLELTTYSYRKTNKYVLNVPNLEYLHLSGHLSSAFVMEDLSSLFHATVSYTGHYTKRLLHDLLKGISRAKSLLWTTPDFDVVLKSYLPKFPNLRHLELKGSICTSWSQFCREHERPFALQHICSIEHETSCSIDIEPQSVPTWMLTSLRTLKITRCWGEDSDIRFIEYMLGNAEVLKTLTITCETLLMKDEMRLCARLLTFPRASRYCQLHFVGKWLNSRVFR